MTVLAVASVLVILVVAAFALQNPQGVVVSFLAWSWQTDVGRLAVASAALGAGAVLLLLGGDDLRLRLRVRQLARQLHRLEVRLVSVEAERDRLASQLDGSTPAEQGRPRAAAPADAPSRPEDKASAGPTARQGDA